ncbi:hypothetical protein DICSQDRAFT_170858 [Dichomitus squalens LYAD-421 SS1]|uniref:Uncharacterized protein n=1 Tax=Dichomitus squalens (strain LYAD-421) TaxID=732165 RepID=R7T0M4_DICSQ|nr:uncharacterized protein DICSQDRAFT_170858 [Dichomitus squalens LYAD-421 SS1]EJF60712.1 hypothetical protein DICSQDRAFT_170858 [Dichomitus squalens LYAD-421 SS1]
MEGIADGLCAYADEHGRSVDVLDIVALNARSEIALGQWDDGCTSLAWRFRNSAGSGFERQLLGQNWDWRVGVGKNLAMVSIEQDGKPKIWMVTEVNSLLDSFNGKRN